MDVRPIALTQFDFTSLAQALKAKGKSDAFSGVNIKKPDGAVKLLAKITENPEAAMRHHCCGFLAVLSQSAADWIVASTRLQVLNLVEDVHLVSGCISEWRDACVYLSRHKDVKVRRFANQCCDKLRQAGFRALWDSWSQHNHPDGTYQLT
jgi:hypothetical protein